MARVKSGVTIYFFFFLFSPPLHFFFPRTRALLRRDFPPLVGNDCDRNGGYIIVDRYIRHGDLREELEAFGCIADTRSHDGAPLPGKTRLDRTRDSLSLSLFHYFFLVLKKERDKNRVALDLTRENGRRRITRDKLYTAMPPAGWRERRKDYVAIVTEITRSTFIYQYQTYVIKSLHDRAMTSTFGLISIINNPFFISVKFLSLRRKGSLSIF